MANELQSGGHFKGTTFTVSYFWRSHGENSDFSTWCRIGKWLGINDRRLSKLHPTKIIKELTGEFPLIESSQAQDSTGRMAKKG